MTQEIKLKLEQAADALFEHKGYSFTPCDYAMRKGFLKGAQTILENPSEWGLVEKRLVDAGIQLRIENVKACEETHLQNEKYRGFLESIDEDLVFLEDCIHHSEGDLATIARKKIREALKQQ